MIIINKNINLKSTGINSLDERLGGGLPEGSLVCIYANPMSMPEILLYQIASSKKTFYFNTSRPSQFIRQNMESLGLNTDNVQFIDIFSQYYLNEYGQFIIEDNFRDKEIFDYVDYHLSKIVQNDGDDYNVIFDTISFFFKLNVSTGLKEWLINKLYVASKQTKNLFFIYLMKNVHPQNIVSTVMDICDVILDVDCERMNDKIVSRLFIPKIRNMPPIGDVFRIYINSEIEVNI
jgi:KaiC/GvpD/RAD55 family RecA-like ATPase